MPIFFKSGLPDETIRSFQGAIAKAAAMPPTNDPSTVLALSMRAINEVPVKDELNWKRVGIVCGILVVLSLAGVAEYHFGASVVADRLFSWAEKIFVVFLGLVTGEAIAKRV